MVYFHNFESFNHSHADLYHAIKTEYALTALETNKLDTYTFQRFWEDGKRKKDDHPEYFNSFYYFGLSLTRDINYASQWSDVIFVFDQSALKTKYKLLPYNWGYSIGNGYVQGHRVKREREEFLIASVYKKTLSNRELLDKLRTPNGSIIPLDRFLKGFYISKAIDKIYDGKNEKLEKLKKHPLFLGLK